MLDAGTDELMKIARMQMDVSAYGNALETLRRVLTKNPENAAAHAWLSHCLLCLRRTRAALHEAMLALKLEPDVSANQYAVACTHCACRDFRKAEVHLQEALRLAPDNTDGLIMLARVYAATGRPERMHEPLNHAIKLEPDNANVLAELGNAHFHANGIDISETMARRALALEPENVNALVLMGWVLLRRGNVTDARQHALWVLAQDATNLDAMMLMSVAQSSRNPIMALSWRYNHWIAQRGEAAVVGAWLIVLGTFLFGSQLIRDFFNGIWMIPLAVLLLFVVVIMNLAPAAMLKGFQEQVRRPEIRDNY